MTQERGAGPVAGRAPHSRVRGSHLGSTDSCSERWSLLFWGSGCTASRLPVGAYSPLRGICRGCGEATCCLPELEIFISSFELFTLPAPFVNVDNKDGAAFWRPGPRHKSVCLLFKAPINIKKKKIDAVPMNASMGFLSLLSHKWRTKRLQ